MEARKRAAVHPALNDTTARVRECLRASGATTLQNILMRVPDKVCAVAFAALPEEERAPLYAAIAPQKAARVQEEMRLEARRRTTAVVRGRIIRSFLSYFGKARNSSGPIWIRPKKPR